MFAWKRFWCAREGSYSLGDGGFLLDPDAEYAKFYQQDAVPFGSIYQLPCLGLLGEPGIGKSTAIESVIADVRQSLNPGDELLSLDLKEFSSDIRLEQHLVGSETFKRWLGGNGTLHLILDSLDECRIQIPNVAALLMRSLRDHAPDLSRLRVRIACRTADWPQQLDFGLAGLWPDGYGVYELLPLRRTDVELAAVESGIDPNQFVNAVRAANAQPLAIKPVTLRFLLNTFKANNSLPRTQVELYESGCRLLAAESSDSRRDAGHTGKLDADQRLAVASRIAAVMTLCGKSAVSLHSVAGTLAPDTLSIGMLTGGTESAMGNPIPIDDAAVRETLATGIFAGRGPQHVGFAHQTYAEFLTARYLASRNLDIKQIASLVCHPADNESRVVPQLAETVGWLASMNRTVFAHMAESNPTVLVRSDAAIADNADRATLVRAVLEKLNKVEVDDRDWTLRERCARFVHPGLGDQLKPYIIDKSKDVVARRTAIDIAEFAGLTELQDALVSVALDQSDICHIRDQAAHAIAHIGDDDHRILLKPLLAADEKEDPDDQLRGCAMRGLWPRRLITLDDLLAAIAPSRRKSLTGAYDMFLSDEFVPHLEPSELPTVLRWLQQSPPKDSDGGGGLRRTSDAVVNAALEKLNDDAIRAAMADYAIVRLEAYDQIHSNLADDSDKSRLKDLALRRRLVSEMVLRVKDFNNRAMYLTGSQGALLAHTDLSWLIEQARMTTDKEMARRYAVLATWVFSIQTAADVELVLSAACEIDAVRMAFDHYLRPVGVDSEEAHNSRKQMLQHRARMEKRSALSTPSMTTEVMKHLDRFEAGDVDAWWQLNHCMLFDLTGRRKGNEIEDDLRELPGWTDADDATRTRIVQAAKAYLTQGDPANDCWLGTHSVYNPAYAGYRALVLLANEKPDVLSELPSQAWAKWAAVVLSFPVAVNVVGTEPFKLDLAEMAYANAPTETIDALLKLIDRENSNEFGHLHILRKMQNCWNSTLCEALLNKASDPSLNASCVGDLLKALMEHGCAGAKDLAKSHISAHVPAEERVRSLAHASAVACLEAADDAGWDVLWPAIESDSAFGKTVIEAIAFWDQRTGRLVSRLSEADAAKLYIWLERQYPHESDPDHDGAHAVGSREAAGHFRDSVLRTLTERGTPAAVIAIQSITNELPHLKWLKYVLVGAKDKVLRQTWIPPGPADVLSLCTKPSSRMVRTATELQEVLMEILGEIDQDMQGETPAAPDLWNLPTYSGDPTQIRPKEENRLSDWLKRCIETKLAGRGIIALREVVIRQGVGVGDSKIAGERIDIHVTGMVPGVEQGAFDLVRVIVEVKGCWNKELLTAMESQLTDRYLRDNDCQHGIYVVGWYACSQWNDADSRNADTPSLTLAQVRQRLDAQAANLTTNSRIIRSFVLNTALR